MKQTYETIGKIEGFKVLKGLNEKHGLSEESHSSKEYLSLHPNGSPKQLRIYGDDLKAIKDIEYSIHQGKLTLYAHDYLNYVRQKARDLTYKENKKYSKLFGGKK